MKKLILTLCTIMLGFFSMAQSSFESKMLEKINQLNVATDAQKLQILKDDFISIAKNSDSWLPDYYAALSTLKEAQIQIRNNDFTKIDQLTDEAASLMKPLATLESTNSEIRALKAYMYVLRMSVNPSERIGTDGRKAREILYQSSSNDFNNPRFDLTRGLLEYYFLSTRSHTKNLGKYFQGTASRLKAFSPKSKLDPNWGLNDAEYYISIIK